MSAETLILAIALIGGLYMAWNIGANDVANAMGTSVGSGAVTFKQAVILAGIFEFLGAMLVGGHVTDTIRKGIVSPEVLADPDVFIAGMLSALLAAAIWLNVATYFGLPVSTTHSIVGAIFGFGLLYGGFGSVNWGKLCSIVASWIISPLAGALLGYGMFRYINSKIFKSDSPALSARAVGPRMVFMVIFILVLSIIYKGLTNLHLNFGLATAVGIAAAAGLLAALICRMILARIWKDCDNLCLADQLDMVEQVFRILQVFTACYVAFAHGANDVANAVGPLAGVYTAIKMQAVSVKVAVPPWILALGAVGIVVGLVTWGYRVIATVGEKITELTPTRGFAATFACATTVLVCSRMGLPISTTHTLVGAVVGVGLARGISALDRKVVVNIAYSWIITIPAAAILTALLYPLISRI